MFRHRRKHLRHFLTHRLPAGLVLVAYLVALFGIPVPVSAGKDHRTPFPCQDHLCGCRNAEDCWRHCCCFSLEERLAWARSRGIEPPAYAVHAAEGASPHACAHCRHCEPSPAHDAPAPKPCCAKHREAQGCRHTAPGHRGLSFCALRCQGLHSWWVSTLSVVPPPLRMSWNPQPVCTGWLAERDINAPALSPTPPDPPPRSLFI